MITKLVSHTPSALIGNSELSLKFLSRYSMTSRSKQVYGIEPLVKRSSGLFKRSSLAGINMISTELASIGSTLCYAVILGLPAALLADRMVSGVEPHDLSKASITVWKFLLKLIKRVSFHSVVKIPNLLLVVKG